MPAKYIVFAILAVSIKSANFPLTKIVIAEIPPLLAVSLRLSIMSLICLPFVKIPFGQLKDLFLLSFTLLALPLGLTAVSLTEVDSSIAALSVIFSIPTAQLLSYFLLNESLNKEQIIGLAFALVGCYLIVASPEIDLNNADSALYLVIGAISYAYSTIQVKKVQATPAQIAVYAYFFSIPQLLIMSLIFERDHLLYLTEASTKVYLLTLVIGTSSVLYFIVWSNLLKRFTVSVVTPFTFLLPVVSLGLGYLILGETTNWLAVLGGLTAIVGISFQITKHKRGKTVEP